MTNSRKKLRIGWMGHHVEGVKPLEDLLAAKCPLHCIITLEQDVIAKRSGAVDYSQIAAEHGLELYRIRNVNDAGALDLLASLNLDVLLVIGWSQIIGKDALDLVNIGCFGAHASLLPANRGSAPINWALIKGEKKTGNTLMKLSEDVDGGDIVAQRDFEITPFDNVATLYEKVAEMNSEMILTLMNNLLSGKPVEGDKQVHDESPPLPRRRPQDGAIDWTQPAQAVYDFIRALTRPYPGAFSFILDKKFLIWRSALLPFAEKLGPAGKILGPVVSDDDAGCGIAVACGTGAIIVLEMEDQNGRILSGENLACTDFPGEWSSR